MSLRQVLRLHRRSIRTLPVRSVSHAPLPPPSSLGNIGEYIEPKWVTEEHAQPSYRESNHIPRWSHRVATFCSALVWTWILSGFYYESEHVFGHFPWPDASKWTDKELGIPDTLELDE